MFSKQNLLLALGLCISLVSCDYYDFEAIQPIDSVPADIAITNLQSARAARAGVYDELQDSDEADLTFDGYLALPLLFSDDCVFTGTFPTRAEFADFNVITANGTMNSVWLAYYDAINVANNLLEILPRVEDVSITDEIRNSILAEARFARAFCYFNLIQGWNEVPLVLTPTRTVGDELNIAKSSRADIVTQIMDDLTFARDNFVAGQTLGMNSAGASALMARLNLIEGNFGPAMTAAEAAVGADYDLTAIPYLADEIFYLKFSGVDGNSNAFFFGTDVLGGRHSIEPSATLFNAFEEGDARRELSIDTTGGTPYGLKYDDFGSAAGSQTDPLYLFRGAEMVLIMAEVAARNGDFDTANGWINQVRNRAGLEDVDLADEDDFMDAILQERFVELNQEGGHRLWDLRRTGRAEEVLGPLGYDACDNVWPLPQADIDRNPNLEQNGCCNC